MMFKKLFSHKIADPCAEKSTYYLNNAASEKKSEGTAGKCRSKPEIPGLVVAFHILKFVKHHVELLNGVFLNSFCKSVGKMLQLIELISVYARGIYGNSVCIGLAAAYTGIFDRE